MSQNPLPDDKPAAPADDGSPKFGRLLIVLLLAVLLVGVITLASEALLGGR
ncbi:hypothetical protein [Massilia glaciei]|uniref:hypothetical protein n=1 Tax=Massilia glaciei TaxID=1524097 RepID=UPI0015E82799|nr:hypothetical protein [Massilia glaciei]